MGGFESILSQEGPVRILTRLLEKEKIPHAFLFTGIDGVGKRMTAMTFAMALNCTGAENTSDTRPGGLEKDSPSINAGTGSERPCGVCRSCRKIQAGSHPDILIVEPDGAMIKIQQIRNLIQTLALKPYEAGVRTAIIGQSHTMNPAAGNALLKILEEPPYRTILILTAPQTRDMLPTIVSRCRQIRFNPLSQQHIQFLLEKNQQMDGVKARIAATMAGGSYSNAVIKCRDNWVNHRHWLLAGGGFDRPDMLNRMTPQVLLAFSEKLAGNKDLALASLGVIALWLRDLMVWRYKPDSVINKDLKDRIREAARTRTVSQLAGMLDAVIQARRDIRANMNVRLSLDMMMLKLARI